MCLRPSLDFSRLWTFTNYSGEAGGNVFPQSDNMLYLFLLCLLLPVYTITGYDASAHTSEETTNAATSVPQGIVSSVIWSSLVGWIMLCAITLAIPDMDAGAKQGWGMFFGTMDAIMPAWLKTAGLSRHPDHAVALRSGNGDVGLRMLFAFSRDDGMPGSRRHWRQCRPKYRTPVNAIWTATVLCILYVFLAQSIKVGDTNIYMIVVNSTLVFLFLSFMHSDWWLAMLAYGGTASGKSLVLGHMGQACYKLVTRVVGCWHGDHLVHRRAATQRTVL